MKRNRALTIVELLVVLLVVGIAALLLYPVFGSAKEAAKRSLCMSNMRRIGKAIAGYVAANDNVYPMSYVRGSDGWLFSEPCRFPENWAAADSAEERKLQAGFWANAIRDTLDKENFVCPQSVVSDPYEMMDVPEAPGKERWSISYSYNGYLHALDASRLTSVETAITLWAGQGKAATLGAARSNPLLLCRDPDVPCVFRKGVETKVLLPKTFLASNTMWLHGRGANFLLADMHVRWRRLASVVGNRNTNADTDPFQTYDKGGNPERAWMSAGIAPLFAP